ncbi:MAG TPA: hypothetical protein VN922_08600 [Bacteroidia bacterium]|nr:hypothetical protein [Bacteroidia bacterium]
MNLRLFFLKLLLYIALVLSGLLYFDHRLAHVGNSYNVKRHNLEQQIDSVEVLVLGASHSLYGINPAYFSHKGFNLSNIDQDMYFNSALLDKYISRLPKLKLVIIDIDYSALNYSLANSLEEWRCPYYQQFWGVKSNSTRLFDIRNYSLTFLYSNSLSLWLAGQGFNANFASNLSYNGWIKNDTSALAAMSDQQAKERMAILNDGIARNTDKGIRHYIEKMVSELCAKNIKVQLISMPVFNTCSKYCNKDIITQNNLFADSLCKKYGCKYTNYFTDDRFTVHDFGDIDHLDFIGAEKFSKILDNEIIHPALN